MADELVLLDLVGVVADVAAGAGDVPTGADDLRQVLALVDPARVAGLPGVADQQRAGVAVGERLLLGLLAGHLAVRTQSDVAVRVDEPRQHPALERLHVAHTGRWVGVKVTVPVDDPQLVDDSSGPTRTRPRTWSTGAVMARP